MAEIDETLRRAAAAWREEDPDDATRAELDRWLADGDTATLTDAFTGTLVFGTAGLRGLLGPGPNRMNRLVVARATHGVVAHLLATVPEARERGVAIGFDGRRMSREFAADVASIVAGAGVKVLAFDETVATPVLSFAVKHHGAAAGIMITASHNPPAYNGYKVYWENSAQIIPPTDGHIAAAIATCPSYGRLPRVRRADAEGRGLHVKLGAKTERAYLDGVRALVRHAGEGRSIPIAYTALHGVGERFVRIALREAGFERVATVAAQAEPDGAFPTVAFPNPEEKGAMDLVLALARETKAELVLANDPDADRLAVAIPDAASPTGYRQLTGNEVGVLLAHYLLSDEPPQGAKRLVASSIVSSPMLGEVARAHGTHWEQTLTGFKWIANRAIALEKEEGQRFVMGYEEALGYTVGTLVRDKDGVSGATVFADFAGHLASHGRSVRSELDVVAQRYGLYLSEQVSLTLPGAEGAARIGRIMAAVRRAPPRALAGVAVTHVVDLEEGVRHDLVKDSRSPLAFSESANVLALELVGGSRVMLRPSGTEPKIKLYFDVRVVVGETEKVEAARARGATQVAAVVREFRGLVDAIA